MHRNERGKLHLLPPLPRSLTLLLPQTDSSSTPLPSLFRLPNELLGAIFRLAYDDSNCTGPLGKALLPFYLDNRCRHLRLTSPKQFPTILEALDIDPAAANLVETLSIHLGVMERSSNAFTVAILARLPRLCRLTLRVAESDLYVDLLERMRTNPLVRLQHLDAKPPHSNDQASDDAVFFAALRHSPSLSNLHLRLHAVSLDFFETVEASLIRATNVTHLKISDNEFAALDPHPLVDLFPALTHLTLCDEGSWPAFGSLLAKAPTTLKSLVLSASQHESYVYPALSLDYVLPRFEHLEHLELCESSFSPDLLLHHLRSLAVLKSLTFGPASPVTDDLLLSFVQSPTELPHLSTLTLVRSDFEETTAEALNWPDESADGPRVEEPLWYDQCTLGGLELVLSAANVSGIEVRGVVADAVRREAEERIGAASAAV